MADDLAIEHEGTRAEGGSWARPRLPGTRMRHTATAGVGAVAAYTVATLALPDWRLSWFSPSTRIAIEVLGLCIALFVVLALLLPDDGDVAVTRNAFVAVLLTVGVSNLVFGVWPLLVGAVSPFGGVYSFYPWLAARYIAGGLFIAASLGRPRLELRWYLALVAGLLVAVDLTIYLLRGRLPLPFADLSFTPGGVTVTISTPPQILLIAVVPGLLYAAGAWLAARTHRRGASLLYRWVALALAVQALAKVHEILYPSVLGARITTADLLRLVFFGLLLAGALLKVRQLVRDRGLAVEALAGDLRAQEELLASMHAFAEREETFRSVVVHEMATPIATLRAFAHVLTEQDGGDVATRRHVAAEGVRSESRRLAELVTRMEELRTLELEQFACELRPVRLRPLVDEAVAYLRGLPGWHAAVVSSQCDHLDVQADPVRLGQALRNVLTNAARYSPERSPIRISCRAGGEGRVQVEVVDEGPGIPPGERERLLGKFERGANAASDPGSGLGLYIANRILQGHGGRLELGDDPQFGARVVLELNEAGPR